MRGATARDPDALLDFIISIHAPHAGSDWYITLYGAQAYISIHAPHAGSD